jgi:DNA/RNA-binding domain of Phe-tRNA-synthetase-like protein
MNHMQEIAISINPEIFGLVPEYRRAIVVGSGIVNAPSSPGLVQALRDQEAVVRQGIGAEDPRLVAWRDAFQAVGIKPNKFRPSIDALSRRVINGGELPSISTLVDIGTILSLRHVLPCGAHSLNDVKSGLELRRADGTEQFTPFGTDAVETIPQGEIIFADGNVVATSKWAWRQASHTIITPDTTAFELNIDALGIISDDDLAAAVADAQAMIRAHLGIETTVLLLDKDTPRQTASGL